MRKTHKIICRILGFSFLIIGLIGLALPVIPQVPFLLASVFFLTHGSEKIKNWIFRSKLYREHIKDKLAKHETLRHLLEGEQ